MYSRGTLEKGILPEKMCETAEVYVLRMEFGKMNAKQNIRNRNSTKNIGIHAEDLSGNGRIKEGAFCEDTLKRNFYRGALRNIGTFDPSCCLIYITTEGTYTRQIYGHIKAHNGATILRKGSYRDTRVSGHRRYLVSLPKGAWVAVYHEGGGHKIAPRVIHWLDDVPKVTLLDHFKAIHALKVPDHLTKLGTFTIARWERSDVALHSDIEANTNIGRAHAYKLGGNAYKRGDFVAHLILQQPTMKGAVDLFRSKDGQYFLMPSIDTPTDVLLLGAYGKDYGRRHGTFETLFGEFNVLVNGISSMGAAGYAGSRTDYVGILTEGTAVYFTHNGEAGVITRKDGVAVIQNVDTWFREHYATNAEYWHKKNKRIQDQNPLPEAWVGCVINVAQTPQILYDADLLPAPKVWDTLQLDLQISYIWKPTRAYVKDRETLWFDFAEGAKIEIPVTEFEGCILSLSYRDYDIQSNPMSVPKFDDWERFETELETARRLQAQLETTHVPLQDKQEVNGWKTANLQYYRMIDLSIYNREVNEFIEYVQNNEEKVLSENQLIEEGYLHLNYSSSFRRSGISNHHWSYVFDAEGNAVEPQIRGYKRDARHYWPRIEPTWLGIYYRTGTQSDIMGTTEFVVFNKPLTVTDAQRTAVKQVEEDRGFLEGAFGLDPVLKKQYLTLAEDLFEALAQRGYTVDVYRNDYTDDPWKFILELHGQGAIVEPTDDELWDAEGSPPFSMWLDSEGFNRGGYIVDRFTLNGVRYEIFRYYKYGDTNFAVRMRDTSEET